MHILLLFRLAVVYTSLVGPCDKLTLYAQDQYTRNVEVQCGAVPGTLDG